MIQKKMSDPAAADTLNSWRTLIEDRLRTHIPAPTARTNAVSSAMHYATQGGHRWRPLLLMACYRAVTSRPVEEGLDAACAIEIVHCCTTIVDDLPFVDNATQRRGRPSCHIVYGQAATVYASHLLFAMAERLAVSNARQLVTDVEAIRSYFTRLRSDLIDAQVLETTLNEGMAPASRRNLKRLYELKGLPFAAAGWLGLSLGRADGRTCERFLLYAQRLGMAYQLADDLLDVIGNSRELGKSIHMDRGKVNLVTTAGQDEAVRTLSAVLRRATSLFHSSSADTTLLSELTRQIIRLPNAI